MITVLSASLHLGACSPSGGNTGGKEPEQHAYIAKEVLAEQILPSSLPLFVESTNGYLTEGFGAEIDPTFLTQKVGKNMPTYDGKTYTVQAEDWNKYIIPAFEEMKPQKVRVMFVDTYICSTEHQFLNKDYDWQSEKMQDLRRVLGLARANGARVNLTFWGCGQPWLMEQSYQNWVTNAKPALVREACVLFADAVQRLLMEGYDCISEITFYNEPNYYFYKTYGFWEEEAYAAYVDTLLVLKDVFDEYGLSGRLTFNMSDDSNDRGWMTYVLSEAKDYLDIVNTHQYYVRDGMTQKELTEGGHFSLAYMRELRKNHGVPIVMNEFGVDNGFYEQAGDNQSFFGGERALTLANYLVNAMNHGVSGFNYWCFYPCHGADFFSLISFSSEYGVPYLPTQFYYAYSLFTRLTAVGSEIYEIQSDEEGISAVALKSKDGTWCYLLTNLQQNDRIVSVANCFAPVHRAEKYTFLASNQYRKQIASEQTVTATGRISELVLPAGSFVLLKQITQE
ncbi:MAG: hypothetical protein IJF71_00805 [Clostridia bacterium]|nr:hypothetical protein [Clostridia bacterium]